jgi:hypothetical protein
MFVGHGLLAFALVAAGARLAGWAPERALAAGLLAGAFGLAPDVDILYAPVGALGASGPLEAASGFWAAGNRVHRTVTHSLVVATVAALAAGAWATDRPAGRAIAVLALAGLVVVGAMLTGPLAAVVLAAFAAVVLGLARVGAVRQGFAPPVVAATALVGLATHPFGDLFTGEPPALYYPLDLGLLAERVVLHPDPTLHLLGALFAELGTAWLAAGVLLWLHAPPQRAFPVSPSGLSSVSWAGPRVPSRAAGAQGIVGRLGSRLRRSIDGRAGLAVGFAGVTPLLPAPTLELSYHFVFPLLGVGLAVAAVAGARATDESALQRAERAGLSGLTALSLAALAYTVAYVLVG